MWVWMNGGKQEPGGTRARHIARECQTVREREQGNDGQGTTMKNIRKKVNND